MTQNLAYVWEGRVERPGFILGQPEEIYHADVAPEPSLSSSVARIALNRSLRHAQFAHPRFKEPEDADAAEEEEDVVTPARHLLIGSAVHTFVLKAGQPVVDCQCDAFRTKEAKARRDLVLANNGIPLRTRDFKIAKKMAAISRPFMEEKLGADFIGEVSLFWQERGLWRRGRLDAARTDFRHIVDFKTIGIECPPSKAARIVGDRDMAFQERFYTRGMDLLDPDGAGRRTFEFVFQETEAPYEIAVAENHEAARSLADEQVQAACNLWDRAMITGKWPGYDRSPQAVVPKPWAIHEWEERASIDETLNAPEIIA